MRILVFDTAGIGPAVDGLAAAIADQTDGQVHADLVVEPSPPAAELAAHLRTREDLAQTDVVVLGVGCAADPAAFRTAARAAVDVAKEAECHVLLVNGSTVVADEPRARSVDIAALNLAAVELSMATGISVIDADRAVAELGGDADVEAPLMYRPEAHGAIQRELVRVLADYGFFDDRPLLAQVGQDNA